MAANTPHNDAGIPGAASHIRIARPTRDFAAAERFYVNGLGLSVLWRASDTAVGGHALVMLGWPGAAWHLELVLTSEIKAGPTEEDLLVIYVANPLDPTFLDKLIKAGGERVVSTNPYWEEWGVTIVDPDGYRLVLCRRDWENVVTADSTIGEHRD